MQVDLDELEALRSKATRGPWSTSSGANPDDIYEAALLNAAPSLIVGLREARKRITALELALGDCGCIPGRCEQSPDDALVYYGRICRAGRLSSPRRKRHDI